VLGLDLLEAALGGGNVAFEFLYLFRLDTFPRQLLCVSVKAGRPAKLILALKRPCHEKRTRDVRDQHAFNVTRL
jgi:hypothetical protein